MLVVTGNPQIWPVETNQQNHQFLIVYTYIIHYYITIISPSQGKMWPQNVAPSEMWHQIWNVAKEKIYIICFWMVQKWVIIQNMLTVTGNLQIWPVWKNQQNHQFLIVYTYIIDYSITIIFPSQGKMWSQVECGTKFEM